MSRAPSIEERKWWSALRSLVWTRDRGICQNCGAWRLLSRCEIAHLHELKSGRSRYRDQTCSLCERSLNDPENLVTTCSRKCNDEAAANWEKKVGCRRKRDEQEEG